MNELLKNRNGVDYTMSGIVSFLPFIVIIGVFYFLMMKPQKKAADEKKRMMDALKKGDSIVTIGGLHGEIDEINEVDKTVSLDCDGIYLTFERSSIARVTNSAPTTPVASSDVSLVKEEVIEEPVKEEIVEEAVVVEEETPTPTEDENK